MTARFSWNQENTRGHSLQLRAIALALLADRAYSSNHRHIVTPTRLQYCTILHREQNGLIGLHRFCP
jgi:hypothetical protein